MVGGCADAREKEKVICDGDAQEKKNEIVRGHSAYHQSSIHPVTSLSSLSSVVSITQRFFIVFTQFGYYLGNFKKPVV